eukprot:PhF_6_TR36126/c0_g2_i4/m.52435/K01113/phoD; alkaline phosphatase D
MRYGLVGTVVVLLAHVISTSSSETIRSSSSASFESLRIGFGSCNNQQRDQSMWSAIQSTSPNVWIWLGDAIYVPKDSTHTAGSHAASYKHQRGHPEYQSFVNGFANETVSIIGTWDDHDFGSNDAGSEYPLKESSQKAFLDFLLVPESDAR